MFHLFLLLSSLSLLIIFPYYHDHFLFSFCSVIVCNSPWLPNLAQALLRMCRNQKTEVAAELEDRGDDVVRMIKAFHDQARHVPCVINSGFIFLGVDFWEFC